MAKKGGCEMTKGIGATVKGALGKGVKGLWGEALRRGEP
jgi:hypothetical protein